MGKKLVGCGAAMLKDEKGNVTGALSSAKRLHRNKYKEEELRKERMKNLSQTYAVSAWSQGPLEPQDIHGFSGADTAA